MNSMKGAISLRTQLFSAIVALGLMMGLLLFVNTVIVQRVQTRLVDMVTLSGRMMKATTELQSLVYNMARAEKEYVHTGNMESLSRFEDRREEVGRAIQNLEGLIRTEKGHASLKDLSASYEKYGDLVLETQRLSEAGKKAEMKKHSYGVVWKEINHIVGLLKDMEKEYVETTAVIKRESEEFLSGVQWGMRALLAVAFILLGGIAAVLIQVERGISHVSKAMAQVADRNFNVEVLADREDELGELQKIFNVMVRQIKSLTTCLEAEATTDALTGLRNRRALMASLGEEVRRVKRYPRSLVIAMLDLDGFKQFNDTRGHVEGDRVLKEVADIFRHSVREVDEVGRYGGEEFVIMFPETHLKEARKILERIRHEVELAFREETPSLTISSGLVGFPEDVSDPEKMIEEADKALYHAKRLGKNRIEGYFKAPKSAK